MRFKDTFLLLALVSIMATSLAVVPVPLQDGPKGPKTDHMLIHLYLSEQLENTAIDMGIVEINDWPLSKAWIDAWMLEPEKYTLRDCAEIGIFEIDINNQRWPTGVPGTIPMEGPVEGTDMWRAWQFRRALAHLMDKAYVQTEVMKGYVNLIETPVPLPALAGYTDYVDLEAKGYIYDYDPAEAAAILDAAGFEDTDDDGVRNDPRTGANLEPLIFYIRWDNSPGRREAGERLAMDLGAIGVPVDARVVERTVCFKAVMVEHDYHLYTGYWSLDADADYIYALYHSDFYWHPGFCYNYGGFCSEEFDYWAEKIVGVLMEESTWQEVKMVQEVIMKYVGVIPMWASLGIKDYETGWDGVVNYEGYGIDNRWSFFDMYKPGEDTIDYGLRSNLEGIHVISGIIIEPGTVVDPKVTGLIFDSMIGRNPYNLAEDYGWLATYWLESIPQYGNPYCLFTLRDDATFHDGTSVQPKDVKFSLEFVRDCGPSVQEVKVSRCAGNYPFVMDIALVDTKAEDPTLGDWDVKVYFTVNSSWAPHWVGYMPIINKDLWMAGNDVYGWGYRWPYGETLLTTDLAEGDTTIYVKSTNYFEIGDIIEIGVGTDRLETNKIQSVLDNTLQLDIPLVNPHPEWEVVKYCQNMLGITQLSQNATGGDGDTVIQVIDMKNFAPGDPIVIEKGWPNEETNEVKRTYKQGSIEYIELEYPLKNNHGKNEIVEETAQSAYWIPEKVMEYHPWEHDANDNGVIDLAEDGTGPWIFVDADPLLSEYILLDANRDFYKTQTEISDYLVEAFHAVGDVNYDGAISVLDIGLIFRALTTTPATGGTPGGWDAWNPAADLNKDDIVDISDLYVASIRYGKVAG